MRRDSGPDAVCVAGDMFTLVSAAGPLAWPALARRGDAAMLIFTAGEVGTMGVEVRALPITPLGEPRGMDLPVHRGYAGTIHSFRGAPSPAARETTPSTTRCASRARPASGCSTSRSIWPGRVRAAGGRVVVEGGGPLLVSSSADETELAYGT